MTRKRMRQSASSKRARPEEDEMMIIYRVLMHLRWGESTEDIGKAVGVPRQNVLTYVRRALVTGMLKQGPLPSSLADELRQTLGAAARATDIDIVPARSDTGEFYRWCAEQLILAIRQVLQEKGYCTIAIGGGKSTYKTVRNMPEPAAVTPEEGRRIKVFPATSGVDPNEPLLSALVVGALLRTTLAREPDGEEAPYQAIVSDPYRTDRPWDLRRRVKGDIDLLVSGIGHKQYSYCAGLSGLAGVPDEKAVGEFLFQPFNRDGRGIEPEGFHVDCAEEGTDSAVDSTRAERIPTFYSLFSLGELAHGGPRKTRRPIVIGIASNYLRGPRSARTDAMDGQTPEEEERRTQEVSKVEAVLGALRGGLICRLIVPMDLAEELLNKALREEVSKHQGY